jgi:hypothetical protein
MTVASATSATVTATKRITPITGETASSVVFALNLHCIKGHHTPND